MNSITFVVLAIVLGVALSADNLDARWKQFQLKFPRFGSNLRNDLIRKAIFAKNIEEIDAHNKRFEAGLETWAMGINKFADWTDDEYNNFLSLDTSKLEGILKTSTPHEKSKDLKLPKEIDWVKKGAVTGVKDQGHCGSCYIFSAVGAMEGQLFRKTHKLTAISEQQVLDCMETGRENCRGGWMTKVYEYGMNHGIAKEGDYPPYSQRPFECQQDDFPPVMNVTDFKMVTGNETNLDAALVEIGPLAIALDFTYGRHYVTGVFDTQKICKNLNHGLLVVGYGTENGQDYYLLKNSWGENWGDKGYIKWTKGKNMCGVMDYLSYPIL